MCRYGQLVLCLAAVFGIAAGNQSLAQSSLASDNTTVPGQGYDCTDVEIDYTDDPKLTREEKLALMDEALFRALSKYDACQEAKATGASSAGSAGSGTGLSGSAGGSLASSDMKGEGQSASSNSLKSGDQKPSSDSAVESSNSTVTSKESQGSTQQATFDNGKLPEDIPSVDNDSVLEALIRQAAINETDPEIKAKLWNEYRRYKGLPIVN